MNKIVMAALLGLLSANIAYAADNGCEAKATEKKLAGAAKNSFIKKCVKDTAVGACGAQAAERKLGGAAKTSFLKKCEKDAAAAK